MATSTYGTPYVQGSDLVSAYPTVSSSLATRVDEVSYKRNGLNAQTGTTYTLVVGDAGKTITLSNAAAVAVTLPQDSAANLPIGAVVSFYNLGAGTVTISQGTGATLQGGSLTLTQYAVTSIIKLSANTYGPFDGASTGVKQVKSVTTTAAFSTSSTSYVDWTNLSVSITPTSTSNKVLAMMNVAAQTTAGGVPLYAAIIRTSTTIAETYHTSVGNGYLAAMTVAYLDSPNTTSATTYKVQAKTGNATYAFTAVVNMTYTLTVMEVTP